MNENPVGKKRIALDMDEVIADVTPKFLDLYERDFGERPPREVWWGKKIYQLPTPPISGDTCKNRASSPTCP